MQAETRQFCRFRSELCPPDRAVQGAAAATSAEWGCSIQIRHAGCRILPADADRDQGNGFCLRRWELPPILWAAAAVEEEYFSVFSLWAQGVLLNRLCFSANYFYGVFFRFFRFFRWVRYFWKILWIRVLFQFLKHVGYTFI